METPNTQEGLDQLIYQTEVLKIKMIMKDQYEKNLAFFKEG